jgi:hypothetical protein
MTTTLGWTQRKISKKFKIQNSKSFLFQSPTIKQCNIYICLGYIWTSQSLHTNLKLDIILQIITFNILKHKHL